MGRSEQGAWQSGRRFQQKVINGKTITWKCKLTKPVPLTLTYTAEVDKDQRIGGKLVGTLMGKTVMDSKFSGTAVLAKMLKSQSGKQSAGAIGWAEETRFAAAAFCQGVRHSGAGLPVCLKKSRESNFVFLNNYFFLYSLKVSPFDEGIEKFARSSITWC